MTNTTLTGKAAIRIDDSTTILIRGRKIVVDCDRPPRHRTTALATAVRLAVEQLIERGLQVERTRSHTFEPEGAEHCLLCEGPRVMLCGYCGHCRPCCAANAWETPWWQSGDETDTSLYDPAAVAAAADAWEEREERALQSRIEETQRVDAARAAESRRRLEAIEASGDFRPIPAGDRRYGDVVAEAGHGISVTAWGLKRGSVAGRIYLSDVYDEAPDGCRRLRHCEWCVRVEDPAAAVAALERGQRCPSLQREIARRAQSDGDRKRADEQRAARDAADKLALKPARREAESLGLATSFERHWSSGNFELRISGVVAGVHVRLFWTTPRSTWQPQTVTDAIRELIETNVRSVKGWIQSGIRIEDGTLRPIERQKCLADLAWSLPEFAGDFDAWRAALETLPTRDDIRRRVEERKAERRQK